WRRRDREPLLVSRAMRRALGVALLVAAVAAVVMIVVGSHHRERGAAAAKLASATTTAKAGDRVTRTGATLGGAVRTAADSMTGVDAFREFSSDFLEANPDAIKEHMEREGITRAETKELTYFALLASESQDW